MSSYQQLAGAYDELTWDVGYEKRADFLEKLFRRKLKESVLNVIMLGSFALVIGLMIFATFNDVSRLF